MDEPQFPTPAASAQTLRQAADQALRASSALARNVSDLASIDRKAIALAGIGLSLLAFASALLGGLVASWALLASGDPSLSFGRFLARALRSLV